MAARNPVPLHSQAFDHLQYIRRTMEGAASFTAVPGVGGILMGVTPRTPEDAEYFEQDWKTNRGESVYR